MGQAVYTQNEWHYFDFRKGKYCILSVYLSVPFHPPPPLLNSPQSRYASWKAPTFYLDPILSTTNILNTDF